MTDIANLTLTFLRRIDERVDRLGDDMREVKSRLGALEQQYAGLSIRVDRIDSRVDRIGRRLDLTETDQPN